jgi:hypothetical protein
VKRSDGGFSTTLSQGIESVVDNTVTLGESYLYSLQVVAANGDTSVTRQVIFSPINKRMPEAPVITNAVATLTGLDLTFRVPAVNMDGEKITGLQQFDILSDGVVVDNFPLEDIQGGKSITRSLTLLQGFHHIEVHVTTEKDCYLTVAKTDAYLYAGDPVTSYSESFNAGKAVYTKNAWDTTTFNGYFASPVLNDSVPGVNYTAGVNSWFLLPMISLTGFNHTLEFDHIALVDPADSALVEVSENAGLSYTTVASFNRTNDSRWKESVTQSQFRHETLGLHPFEGKNIVVRVRLRTSTTNADGWYLDNIVFSDALGVHQTITYPLHIDVTKNPILPGEMSGLILNTEKPAQITIRVCDLLGKEIMHKNESVNSGKYKFEYSFTTPGMYLIEVLAREGNLTRRSTEKIVVSGY